MDEADLTPRQQARVRLLQALKAQGYRFVTPNNPTIRTIRRRPENRWAKDLRGVFGWSLPFRRELVPDDLFAMMETAEAVAPARRGGWRATLRVSSVREALFLHSAFPTTGEDAVFFGPDTYRYIRFVQAQLGPVPVGMVVDIGAGSGAGGLMVGLARPEARVVLTDISPAALELAATNARANGVEATCLTGEGLDPVEQAPDLVIANPPFICDRQGQLYQDGGDAHGMAIASAWAESAMERLRPGGRMLLYTGSPIIDGRDPFRERLEAFAARSSCAVAYEELDPDIFGGELRRDAYADVERIAAVGVVIRK